jgi:microcystin degradation protein MlrC
VLLASVLGGFPLADIPHLGLTVVIVTDNCKVAGDALRDELLDIGWRRREDFVFDNEPVAISIARAKRTKGQPIVLVDYGDNHSAGAQTDNMDVLAELVHQGLEDVCAGPFCDPATVEEMIAFGEGSEITLKLGGKWDLPKLDLKGRPLLLSGTVRNIRDAKYQSVAYRGRNFYKELGPTAVLDLGSIQVFVSSQPYEPIDVECFVYAGLEPVQKKFILIKSRQNFRAGFEPISQEIIMVAGPGIGNSNFHTLPYRNILRPIYPVDLDTPKVMKGN